MITTKADRYNEIPEKEIGAELKLAKSIDTIDLAQRLFNGFENSPTPPYGIAESMPFIFDSRTKQFRYANAKEYGKYAKLFTIAIRERDGVINFKTKGSPFIKEGVIFKNELEYPLFFEEWNVEREQQIKLEQGLRLGISPDDIIQKKEVHKQKLKIRIENQHTKRVYTIGIISKMEKTGRLKKSLSIDYVGRELKNSKETDQTLVETIIIQDIQQIKKRVLALLAKN